MKDLSQVYTDHLISCINKQCKKSKEHIDAYRDIFSNNRNAAGLSKVLKEIIFTIGVNNAAGAYFTSLDNNTYLDITMGFGVHLFGHKVNFLEAAICQELQRGLALGPLYENAAEVAALIHHMTGVERSAFYNSGTEAVMVAMRLARAATNKSKIVIFEGSYHGTHDSLLALKSDAVSKTALNTIPGIIKKFTDATILLPYGTEASLNFIQANAHEIAAVLTEPVQSRHLEYLNPSFLVKLRQVTAVNKIIFILDEIITGFRIANGGAAAYFNIQPDLTTFGKVVGGGMPVGIVGGKKELMNFIDGGNWRFGDESMPTSPTTFVAGTFCHHPLAMATAKAALLFLKEKKGSVQEELNAKTTTFCNHLNTWFQQEGYPVSMLNFSSLFRFQPKGKAKLLYYALLKEGVYIWEGRNCFLSTAHGDNEIELLTQKIKKVVIELGASSCLRRTEKTHLSAHTHFIQGAVLLAGKLQKEHFELALKYLFEGIPALKHSDNLIRFVSLCMNDDYNDWIAADTTDNPFVVSLLEKENDSVLYIKASKSICDGWSLILFIRELAKCYSALQQGIPMPEISIKSDEEFIQWLCAEASAVKIDKTLFRLMNAKSVHRTIYMDNPELNNNGGMFTCLLSIFKESVKHLNQEIAIPVAGQIISRNLKVFGPCSTHVPLSLIPKDETTNWTSKLHNKEIFKHAFLSYKHPFPIIFNMDNLQWELNFSEVEALLFNIDEQQTVHELVCNISYLNNQLVISLKYAREIYTQAQAEALLNTIAQNMEGHFIYESI
jgi:glutamate-1-semialdehyde aminotransferase